MGGEVPKQFVPIADRPLLMHTLDHFYRWDASAPIILALPEEHRPYWESLCASASSVPPHYVVCGGETRFHSVHNALAYLDNAFPDDSLSSLVGVHDGVRPLIPIEMIDRCFCTAAERDTAVPIVPVSNSLRFMDKDVSRPVDRSRYHIVQTPQVFRRHLLVRAYRQPYVSSFTDDASVVEALGISVYTVSGASENIKVTTPIDLLTVSAYLS
jgi:2-C-methyl-D-erythritol 4-phosphate cytidylyltransferase